MEWRRAAEISTPRVNLSLNLSLEKAIFDLSSQSPESEADRLELILVDKLCNQCFGTFTVSFAADTCEKSEHEPAPHLIKTEPLQQNSEEAFELPDLRLNPEENFRSDYPLEEESCESPQNCAVLSESISTDVVRDGNDPQDSDGNIPLRHGNILHNPPDTTGYVYGREALVSQDDIKRHLDLDEGQDPANALSGPHSIENIEDERQDASNTTLGTHSVQEVPGASPSTVSDQRLEDNPPASPMCNVCNRVFSCRPSLKRHVRLTHTVTREAFGCALCSFTTKLKYNLKQHYTGRHRMDDLTSKELTRSAPQVTPPQTARTRRRRGASSRAGLDITANPDPC